MSTCILVLGNHRSGTSAIAGVLHHLGIPMGTPGKMGGPKLEGWPVYHSNPGGQFEDNDFVSALEIAHGNWYTPNTHWINPKEATKIRALIKAREAEHPIWGLKTPQLCFALSYLIDDFENLYVITPLRRFESCVASLAERDSLPIPVAEHVLANYEMHLRVVRGMLKGKNIPVLPLHFPEFINSPEKTVLSISEFLADIPLGTFNPTNEQVYAATEFLSPSKRRLPSAAVAPTGR